MVNYETYFRSCVYNIHKTGLGIGSEYGMQHLFIFDTSGTKTGQWLTTATYGSLHNQEIEKEKHF